MGSAKKKKKAEAEALAKLAEPVEDPPEEQWEWTEAKEVALEMTIQGQGQKVIASTVGRHRNTIRAWQNAPEFMKRQEERNAEMRKQVNQRRTNQTNGFTDRIAGLAHKTLARAEENPNNPAIAEHARDWLHMFKAFREEERIDAGENITRIEHSGGMRHEHSVQNISFKTFLKDAMKNNVIDVEGIEVPDDADAGGVIQALTQAVLTEGDFLEKLTDEDAANKELEESKQFK